MPQLLKTSNPALNGRVFQGLPIAIDDAMTLEGTVNKTGILLLCAAATAAYSWHIFMQTRNIAEVSGLMWIRPDRRPYLRFRHHFQTELGPVHSAALFTARRPGTRQPVGRS